MTLEVPDSESDDEVFPTSAVAEVSIDSIDMKIKL